MGKKRKNNGYFKKGHINCNRWAGLTENSKIDQIPLETDNLFAESSPSVAVSEPSVSVPSPSVSLPSFTTRAAEEKRQDEELKMKNESAEKSREKQYFIANVACLEHFFELGRKAKHDEHCENQSMKLIKSEQRLISTSWYWACPGCTFRSTPEPMYVKEKADHKSGRKESTLNKAFCGALLASSIQGTQIAKLLLECGIDPGSVEGINRKCANSVAESVVKQGRECLDETLREAETRDNVRVIVDTVYSNKNATFDDSTPTYRSRIAVGSALDADTGKVYDANVKTSLCPQGGRLLRSGKRPTCCEENDTCPKCRATISLYANIGDESTSIKSHAEKLKNVNVSEVTSDGDGVVADSIKKHFPEGTVHTLDFQHASRNMTKALRKVQIRPEAFPAPTVEEKQQDEIRASTVKIKLRVNMNQGNRRRNCSQVIKHQVVLPKEKSKPKLKESLKQRANRLKKSLSIDLNKRINQEICANHYVLSEKNTKRVVPEELAKKLEPVVEVAIKCVSGQDCGLNCYEHSMVCVGGVHRKRHKLLLCDQGISGITHLNAKEIKELKEIIVQRKTGLSALKQSNPKSSTQKSEAWNKELTVVIPKSVTYIATIHARVLRAVMGRNLGKAKAVFRLLQNANHEISDECKAKLIKLDIRDQKRKRLHASAEYKRRRNRARKVKFDMHEEKKSRETKPVYKKGIEFNSSKTQSPKKKRT